MPLDESVSFNVMLQKGNRIQVPRLIRWHYRIEPGQVLKININFKDEHGSEEFLACMSKDGRIAIPKLTIKLLKQETDKLSSLHNSVFEITLGPPKPQQKTKT